MNSMNYSLVTPEHFTTEQKLFVENFKDLICVLSSQTNIIFGAKDVNSRHFISTDAYAHLVALPKGRDVMDRFDRDMPCEGVAQFADCFVQEDQGLLHGGAIDKKIEILNVHEYGNGLKALICDKHILKHHASQAILGTIYSAHEIDIANFFALIPNYALEFGTGCSIENVKGTLSIGDAKLTEYEHEICFLLVMNWSFTQIACFMNRHRPRLSARVADTIYKCRNRICDKLGISGYSAASFREMLINIGVHRKMPKSFFNCLIGSSLR